MYIQFSACPLKFLKRADSLYCDKDCGLNWLDNEYGCQGADADAFCRLKFCNNSVFAEDFSVTPVSNLSGFSCKGNGIRFEEFRRFQRVSSRFQIQNMGDIYFSNAMINTHGEGYVVANITCASMTRKSIYFFKKYLFDFITFTTKISNILLVDVK